jgi:hypothetical protein
MGGGGSEEELAASSGAHLEKGSLMYFKPKALGLVLVAALAATAVMASAASAQFTSGASHTILSGSQSTTHEFTAGEGSGGITCSTVSFSGTASSTNDSSWLLSSTYSGCKDNFGRAVHIIVSGTTSHEVTRPGSVHCITPCTVKYEVTSGGSVVCVIHVVNPQTNGGITYHNLGGTKGVEMTISSSDVKTVTTGSFFSCGVSEGAHNEGTYTSNTILTGKDTSGKSVAISVD